MAATVDENAAALSALASQGQLQLATIAPLGRRVSQCPHCHQGFGSASLQIHIRRCRALYPDLEAEAAAEEAAAAAAAAAKKAKKRQVPKLIDLCLRSITRNFQALCLDKIKSAPEHEAALIDSLPTDLVHRIITNLVSDNRNIARKEDKQRSKIRELQKEVDELKAQNIQLQTLRHQTHAYRNRLTAQEQLTETLQREADAKERELISAQQQCSQLGAQVSAMQKAQSRFETKIQQLVLENEKLKLDVREARKTEAELFKRLAAAAKTGKTVATELTMTRPRGSSAVQKPAKRPATAEARVVRPRPRTEGSKIPYPSGLSPQYDVTIPRDS